MCNWRRLLLTSLVLVLAIAAVSFAHCIWVETPSRSTVHEMVEIRAFYAHPDDPVEARDMTELSLYLIDPKGEAHPVDLVKQTTYQEARVNPSQEGQWLLVLHRPPSRYRLQEIRDVGKSVLWVGEQGTWVHEALGLSLEIGIESQRENEEGLLEITFSVLYEGEPLAGSEIEVFRSVSQDPTLYEEITELETDERGRVTFLVDPSHRYVFETDHRLPAREVNGVGLFISEVRFRSTLFLGNRL